jgi:hypothetical protein
MTESRDKNPRAGLPARKQLAYLGQFLLGVFLTALFFQLRVSDSRANREDFESIAGVGSLVELPVHGVLAKGTVPEFAELFDAVVQSDIHSWLETNRPAMDESHRQARDLITEWLQERGLTGIEATTLSGKGHGDRIPFLFFRTGVAPLKSRFGTETQLGKNPPIGFLLDEVRHLDSPVTLTVVQKVHRSDFPQLDFEVSQARGVSGRSGYRLVSVVLDDTDRLVATFEENQPQQQQQRGKQSRVFIPVVTEKITGSSVLQIINRSLHADRVAKIATDEVRYQHLGELYGGLRLDNARTMTGNRMLDSFQDVEILGFKFSPRYFWIFTFAFLATALLAIALNLWRDLPNDEPTAFGLDILIDVIAFRVLLWCVVPPATMLLAKPQETLAWWIRAAYWAAFAGLVVTGPWLLWLSVRGFRQDGRPASEASQGAQASGQTASPSTPERLREGSGRLGQ